MDTKATDLTLPISAPLSWRHGCWTFVSIIQGLFSFEKKKIPKPPQYHSELIGVVLLVFEVPRLELRTLANRKLEGPFREMLLKKDKTHQT